MATIFQDNPDLSIAIAEELAKIWEFAKQETFAHYVRENYEIEITASPGWKKLIIAEAREANFEGMSFGSSLIRRFWVVDYTEIRQVKNPMLEDGSRGVFYEMPTIRFFAEGDSLLVSESLGPNLLFRRLHRLSFACGQLRIGDPIKRKTFG